MEYLVFTCPPMPHFIVGGECLLRPGDAHERRTIHNAFDLIYVAEGTLYLVQDGREFDLSAGQYAILYPDTQHKGARVCTGVTRFFWLHFYTAGAFAYTDTRPRAQSIPRANPQTYYIKEPFQLFLPRTGATPPHERKELEQYWASLSQVRIDKYAGTKRYPSITHSQLEQQMLFLRLLALLFRPYAQRPEAYGVARETRDYLDAYYRQDYSLEQLSQQLSYSASHLIRMFRKAYGVSPGQYVLQLRVRAALRLLTESDLPIYRVSEEVGFRSPAYFIKQFKRCTGVTPSEYRRAPAACAAVGFPALSVEEPAENKP